MRASLRSFALMLSLPTLGVLFVTVQAGQADTTGKPPSAMPDACRLLPQADLAALFPGRPIKPQKPMLSPVYKGPQYNAGCMYIVRLPSPTSASDVSRFVSFTVVQYGQGSDGRDGAKATFANMRDTAEKVAAGSPNLQIKVAKASGVGDEAFQEMRRMETKIGARKGDLVFVLTLDNYSEQTLPNALILANQAAARWREGVGMVEAKGVATNEAVDVPADTRQRAQAPAADWPDACALLPPEDVRAVFGDMKVGKQVRQMGTLTFEGREKKVETLPNPITCRYDTQKRDASSGERKLVVNLISLHVHDMAASLPLGHRHYEIARKVGDAKTELQGLGDEASLTAMNEIYIRKGRLNVSVTVGGDTRDRDLYDDATRRVKALAERVAARLP